MILNEFKQNRKLAKSHALFFAEIWWFIGIAFAEAYQFLHTPWLTTATTITLGCAGCMGFTWVIIAIIARSQKGAE